jgi:hypothetical protein
MQTTMQSPGMDQYFGSGLASQDALTSQYSILHQERVYLLNALAAEENQGERLTHHLSNLQASLNAMAADESCPEAMKLRQHIKAVRNKIGACQHRERGLAASLANVVAQMEGMKRYQWRNAQHEYTMQIQQAQHHARMVPMSPARPQFALRSPGFMDLTSQMQYMSFGQPQADALLFSSRRIASQVAVPYPGYTFPDQLYANASPVLRDLSAFSGLYEDNQCSFDEPMSPMTISPIISPSVRKWGSLPADGRRQRAVSLLAPAQSASGSAKSPTKLRNDGAMRSLSLLDGTSAAMKMERMAAEPRSKAATEEK